MPRTSRSGPIDFGQATRGVVVETEPNNSIAQAQPLPLTGGDGEQIVRVTGGADDIEYFDNDQYGESGDDWFRSSIQARQPRLLSVNLMPTDHFVAARVRVYTPDGQEYTEGKHLNETTHEQVEEHRTAIVRTLKPGGVYLLRVEANSPGYDLEVRIRRPAPFTDPREAVRLAMYDHVAQVSAWLMNRPRGNSLDRRLRDTGSMYGSNCMSCHTQSGVWGPAGPLALGYRIENPLHYRHLMNIMYESLRPTNVLKDAANNTSLAAARSGRRSGRHARRRAQRAHARNGDRAAQAALDAANPHGQLHAADQRSQRHQRRRQGIERRPGGRDSLRGRNSPPRLGQDAATTDIWPASRSGPTRCWPWSRSSPTTWPTASCSSAACSRPITSTLEGQLAQKPRSCVERIERAA